MNKTVLTPEGIEDVQRLLNWYFSDTDHATAAATMMHMLRSYIEHNKNTVQAEATNESALKCISDLIYLHEQILAIGYKEDAHRWIETPDGYRQP